MVHLLTNLTYRMVILGLKLVWNKVFIGSPYDDYPQELVGNDSVCPVDTPSPVQGVPW